MDSILLRGRLDAAGRPQRGVGLMLDIDTEKRQGLA